MALEHLHTRVSGHRPQPHSSIACRYVNAATATVHRWKRNVRRVANNRRNPKQQHHDAAGRDSPLAEARTLSTRENSTAHTPRRCPRSTALRARSDEDHNCMCHQVSHHVGERQGTRSGREEVHKYNQAVAHFDGLVLAGRRNQSVVRGHR